MNKIFKAFGAFAAIFAVAGAANAAGDTASQYGNPPASESAQGQTIVSQPSATGQNIIVKVKIKGRRGGGNGGGARYAEQAPAQDVVVDGEDQYAYDDAEYADEEYYDDEEYVEEEVAYENTGRQSLADPFFQPRKGKMALSLDGQYSSFSNDFELLDDYRPGGGGSLQGRKFGWDGSVTNYVLGARYGIADSLEIRGAASFQNSNRVYRGRGLNDAGTDLGGDIKTHEESDFNSWGLGLAWKAADTEDFVFRLMAEYKVWGDSNLVYVEGSGGVRRGDSTIYARVAGYFYNNDYEAYGFGLNAANGAEYVYFEEDNKNPMYIEGTLGLFTELNDAFSIDLFATYASLEWHNTITAGAHVAFQPVDSFMIGVYGNYTLYDNASGKDDLRMWSNLAMDNFGEYVWRPVSNIRLDNPSEFNVGVGATLYF